MSGLRVQAAALPCLQARRLMCRLSSESSRSAAVAADQPSWWQMDGCPTNPAMYCPARRLSTFFCTPSALLFTFPSLPVTLPAALPAATSSSAFACALPGAAAPLSDPRC